AIDLGAAAAMPDLCVNVIGEIERRGALRQIDDMAIRREYVHSILRARELFGEIGIGTGLLMPFEYLPQPCDFFLVAADALAIAVRSLVTPVGTDTKFGLLVHIEGAYLHFEHLAFGADHRRVQRAIGVVLRIGD